MHLLQCIDALFELNIVWRELGLLYRVSVPASTFVAATPSSCWMTAVTMFWGKPYLVLSLTKLFLDILLCSGSKGCKRSARGIVSAYLLLPNAVI